MDIVLLQDDDAQLERFWRLRLRALQDAPEAFGDSYEENAPIPLPELIARQRARMNTENVVFMAEHSGAFVGMTGLARARHHKARHSATIWGVYVTLELRGRGLGRALMQRAIAYGRGLAGLELLHLAVAASNIPALRLYETLGFATWGTEPKALYVNGQYYAEHHMIKAL